MITQIPPTATTQKDRFIRLPEVMRRTALGKSAIYERIAKKTFPASIPLGAGPGVALLESEIDEWIKETVRKARRPQIS